METWFSGLRWLFLALSLVFGTMVQAVPVGGITDAQGIPVGVKDIPVRGDNPWKLHQRYCAEATTLSTVQSAILGPNGLMDARRMPAGKEIDIRCGELKTAYRESSLFASSLREMLRATTDQIQKLESRIASLEQQTLAFHQTVQQVPGEIDRALSFPSNPFWRDIRFWTLFLLLILLALGTALVVAILRKKEQRESFVKTNGRSPNVSEFWVDPLPNKGFSVYILVFDEREKRWRLFSFETRQVTGGLYPDVFGKQWATAYDAGQEMVRILNHYVSHTSPASERRDIERAIQDRVLIEMSAPLRRS